ncbi:MAG: VirB4 family type IV secretion/conjugal transfer ATPase [Rickettsiales bacterium]|nr:VirB4 family type IV secretion/conjugal transfer ATPase [Rickettsiales bacterium]
MLQLTKIRSKKDKYAKREYSNADFIPFLCHWNDTTILTKSEELVKVIKVGGFSFETADDEDLDIRKNLRNTLFKGLETGGTTLYFHIVRRRENIFASSEAALKKAKSNDFVGYVDYEWQKKQLGRETFINELYITIIKRPEKAGAAIVEYMIKKLKQQTSKTEWENQMRDMYDGLEETTGRIMATLSEYSPELLSIVEADFGYYSQILEFFGKIVNIGDEIKYGVNYKNIDHYLSTNRFYFSDKFVEIVGGKENRYAGVVSIKEYGQNTSAGMFDGFLHMPFELIITQSFSFSNRQVAISQMQLQQNRMVQAEDKAVSQVVEISEALDMAMSGKIGFGMHHMTIMCIENSPKKLEYVLSQVAVELSNSGIQPIREKVNLEPAFWGQIPANDDFLVRRAVINTLNLASFVSLHNYPLGKPKGNHWGDAVTILNTTSGTPYYFNFHLRDVGHTTIIGPTGSGKTVLMNFLCAQAQKFNCRMFFFDKDRGAEIFIRAINGVYTIINPEKRCGFNPLKLPENGTNKTFLLEWLRLLVTVNNEQLTSEDIKLLGAAVEGNYKLKREDRVLRNIVPFLGMATENSLASRLSIWHSEGSHAKVFDNDEDILDFSKVSNFGFEMAELLKDPISLNPVLLYLFHRIQISLDGTPTMLVLDEAWALIDNPIFGPKIKDWLKVLRKLNAFVVFATQSVEDASKSDISDTLIQQTATQIFLPNLKATEAYRTAFMVSKREFTLIKTTDPGSRFFLIKQGKDAVVARLDLRGMDDIINILSGRSDTVLLLYEIMKKYGEKPRDWLPVFYKECRELQSKGK